MVLELIATTFTSGKFQTNRGSWRAHFLKLTRYFENKGVVVFGSLFSGLFILNLSFMECFIAIMIRKIKTGAELWRETIIRLC